MSRRLYALGLASARHRRLVVVAWIVGAFVILSLGRASGGHFNDNYKIPHSEAQRAFDLLEKKFPEASGARTQIVFHVADGKITDPANEKAITAALDDLAAKPDVNEVSSPFDSHAISANGQS